MKLTAHQMRLQSLILDTVSELCHDRLEFRKGIQIEGLLAITVDDQKTFVVQLNDCITEESDYESEPEVLPSRKRHISSDLNISPNPDHSYVSTDPDHSYVVNKPDEIKRRRAESPVTNSTHIHAANMKASATSPTKVSSRVKHSVDDSEDGHGSGDASDPDYVPKIGGTEKQKKKAKQSVRVPVQNKETTPSKDSKRMQLWQFLLEVLKEEDGCVQWLGFNGQFKIVDPDELARKWGAERGKPGITYKTMARSIRNYYEKKIITKVDKDHFEFNESIMTSVEDWPFDK